jgi:hypothetical protein
MVDIQQETRNESQSRFQLSNSNLSGNIMGSTVKAQYFPRLQD